MSMILQPQNPDHTLVVGDVHVGPKQNLRRASWLGWAINDIRPKRVVFIGDFMTFDALSAWDRNKRRKMEGRRYQEDIDAGIKFLELMYAEIDSPEEIEFVMTEGNHEDRLWRYLDTDPTFEGSVDYVKDLGLDKLGWKMVPYKGDYKHRGVAFTHIPISANGRAIARKDICSAALDTYGTPIVFGHTHRLANGQLHRKGTPHLQEALNVGCYFEHVDEYAQGSMTNYWRGLVLIKHHKNNRFGYQTIPMGDLRSMYNAAK